MKFSKILGFLVGFVCFSLEIECAAIKLAEMSIHPEVLEQHYDQVARFHGTFPVGRIAVFPEYKNKKQEKVTLLFIDNNRKPNLEFDDSSQLAIVHIPVIQAWSGKKLDPVDYVERCVALGDETKQALQVGTKSAEVIGVLTTINAQIFKDVFSRLLTQLVGLHNFHGFLYNINQEGFDDSDFNRIYANKSNNNSFVEFFKNDYWVEAIKKINQKLSKEVYETVRSKVLQVDTYLNAALIAYRLSQLSKKEGRVKLCIQSYYYPALYAYNFYKPTIMERVIPCLRDKERIFNAPKELNQEQLDLLEEEADTSSSISSSQVGDEESYVFNTPVADHIPDDESSF